MLATDDRQFSEATARNREPILEVLSRHVRASNRVLEIASGAGEHAVFLAERLGVACWQPTDKDSEARRSIDAWREFSQAKNVLPAMEVDAANPPWDVSGFTVVVCINMIHISPWRACEGLFEGASSALRKTGIVYMYGPYKREGVHTAPSNEVFDRNLRSRSSQWGVRDMEAVTGVALSYGFVVDEVVAMPANNFSIVFKR